MRRLRRLEVDVAELRQTQASFDLALSPDQRAALSAMADNAGLRLRVHQLEEDLAAAGALRGEVVRHLASAVSPSYGGRLAYDTILRAWFARKLGDLLAAGHAIRSLGLGPAVSRAVMAGSSDEFTFHLADAEVRVLLSKGADDMDAVERGGRLRVQHFTLVRIGAVLYSEVLSEGPPQRWAPAWKKAGSCAWTYAPSVSEQQAVERLRALIER